MTKPRPNPGLTEKAYCLPLGESGYLVAPGASAQHKAHRCNVPTFAGITPRDAKGAVWVCSCRRHYECIVDDPGWPLWSLISARRARRLARKAAK